MEWIRRSTMKLFSNKLKFFGIALYRFRIESKDLPAGTLGYVEAINNEVLPVIFLAERLKDKPTDQVCFVILHELLHLLLHHLLRPLDRDPMLWQLASDHVVNSFLREIKEVQPPGRVILFHELTAIKPHMTVEEAYDHLKNMIDDKFKAFILNDNQYKVIYRNETYEIDKDLPPVPPHQYEDLAKATNNIKKQINTELDAIKSRGLSSGDYFELIKNLLEVALPWDKVLENAIGSTRIPAPDQRSWSQINRFYHHLVLMPGTDWVTKPQDLVVVVDTSGSISSKELAAFARVIVDSLKFFTRTRVITHDAVVQQDEVFEDEHQVRQFLSTIGLKGRGGTSHDQVLTLLDEADEASDISLVIFLTDLYSDLTPTDRRLQRLPYLVVVPKNHHKIDGFNPIVINV